MEVTSLMVDTSAYAAFKNGHPEVVTAMRRARSILIPVVVLGELYAGFEVGKNRQKNRSELRAFQASPRVSLARVTSETAERYARIYAYLRGIGRPIPTNDLWIAASTMEHSADLLTLDAHFLTLPQIMVTHISSEGR